ncbi:MAG: sugar phosphate nucleotidyltransferase [Patescibacteria group bacterium]
MGDFKDHLYALIFCGGGGTRLWPFSREKRPKQFLKVKGGKTLIRQAYARVASFIPNERIFVVTVPDYTDEAAEMLSEIPRDQVLVEPARRNTAMAAGLGAVAIAKKDPVATVVNIWSDHLITGQAEYQKAILAGARVAWEGDNLVTTGIKPRYPHTGLGYVKKEKVHDIIDGVSVYKVEKFTEKPKLPEAKKMITSESYLWHQGTLIWRVDNFMRALSTHSTDTYNRLQEISENFGKPGGRAKILKAYLHAPDMSIDVALAEKAQNFYIVEAKFEWDDLGDFSVLWEISDKDKEGNSVLTGEGGEWLGIDTLESMVISEGKRMVATLGLTDMIVVATDDAVLVAPKSMAQKVKKIVEELKERKKTEFL